ncbi:DUF2029 domain-containing protein [bacterium C-53]|nr:DUF2029 domain-containing protein [Lachnospiraceae bacterium]NBI01505.1 DUF2029 domain-containing protein [Lachnospiraceae bacterium]RKJ12812.1 DUF2029 domain-containing protein [bacterium C-53]
MPAAGSGEKDEVSMVLRGKREKYLRVVLYGILGLLAAVSIVQGCRNAEAYSQDFQWDAAKALVLRVNPYTESLNPTGALDAYGFEEYFKQMEANQFPSLLFLLFPYTLLTPLAARYAWLISNLVFTGAMVWLLRKTFFKEMQAQVFYLLVLLMIAGTPWRNQIGVGQHTIFSFLFFLLAVYFTQREKTVLASLSLVVCYFKYTLTVPLALYFVYKRKWKELVISVSIHILLTIGAAFWLKESFLAMIIEPLKVSSALSGEGSMDIGALMGGGPYAFVLAGLVMAGLLFLSFVMPKDQEPLLVSILLLWSLIVTYHRSYDYFVMILPFCYFNGLTNDRKWENAVYTILVFAVFFVLRLFSESPASLAGVGIFYYLVTFALTGRGIRHCILNRR